MTPDRFLRPTILVAEDDPDQAEVLCDELTRAGYDVDLAVDGETAYMKLLEREYDLAILDVRMPGLNGNVILRAYRARDRDARLPVIIVSAFATQDDMHRFRSEGADICLSKPYELHELLTMVDQLAPVSVANPTRERVDAAPAHPNA